MQNNCTLCGRTLCADDIGASKKLINRGLTGFMCIPCLAAKFGVSEQYLHEKIEFWRQSGCLLFPPKTD